MSRIYLNLRSLQQVVASACSYVRIGFGLSVKLELE